MFGVFCSKSAEFWNQRGLELDMIILGQICVKYLYLKGSNLF